MHGCEIPHCDELEGLDPKERVALIEWIDAAGSRMARRNRAQAIQTFPVLILALVRYPSGLDNIALTATIDEGVPLIDAIASVAAVKKGTVRYLRGRKASLFGPEWLDNPFQLLRCLDETPDHRRPTSSQEWTILWQLWRGCIRASGPLMDIGDYELGFHRWCSRYYSSTNLDDHLGEFGKHVFTGLCSSGYTKAEELLQPHQIRGDCWGDLSDFVIDVGRWCEQRARDLKFNVHVADISRDRIALELLMQYPAIKLMELSALWRQTAIRSQIIAAEIAHWPPLLPVAIHSHGLTVISLTDSFQLAEEGRQLKHCVSTYTTACLLGLSHILSIQDKTGASLSTAEISLEDEPSGRLMPKVHQHVGLMNSEPDPSSQAALADVIHRLSKPRRQNWLHQATALLAEREQEIEAYLADSTSDVAIGVISEILPHFEQVDAWLQQRLIQEEFWYYHRNDLEEEAAIKVGLVDLHCHKPFEAWWSDPFRWQQYERVSGHEQFF